MQEDDGTEVSANRDHLADLFESDIMLNLDQMTDLENTLKDEEAGKRMKRKVIVGDYYRWKSPIIPFTFGTTDCK